MAHNKDRQQGFAGVGTVTQVRTVGLLRSRIIIGIVIAAIIGGTGYLLWPSTEHKDGMKADDAAVQAVGPDGEALVEAAAVQLTAQGGQQAAVSGLYTGTTVSVAVLADPDLFDFSNDRTRGCDVVVMVPKTITPTPKVLNAALATLFSDTFDYGFTPGNFIATQKDLAFDHAVITSGVANVYLTGTVGPIAGVCDVPRIENQIRETALQFSTVSSVAIFLNGEPLKVE